MLLVKSAQSAKKKFILSYKYFTFNFTEAIHLYDITGAYIYIYIYKLTKLSVLNFVNFTIVVYDVNIHIYL